MKIIETEDEITLRDVPFGQWTIGCISTLFIGIVFVALIGAAMENPRWFFSSMDGSWLGSIMAMLTSGFCFGVLLLAFVLFFTFILMPARTTKINRRTKSIEVKNRGLFKNKTQVFEFSQIQKFASEKNEADTSLRYSVVLVLINNKRIQLETSERFIEETEELLKKLNSFIKA